MDAVWTLSLTMPPAVDEDRDEAALVAASLSGDAEAFARLVRLHQHRVFRLAGRFFRQRADVEDLAQETFLLAWRKLATYRSKAPFEHWLTRLCLNCCYARLRKPRVREQPLEFEHGGEHVPDPYASLELRQALGLLSPHDKFILLLLDGEGWTVAEIAQKLGWTHVNVKVRAHRARKKLRRLLEEA